MCFYFTVYFLILFSIFYIFFVIEVWNLIYETLIPGNFVRSRTGVQQTQDTNHEADMSSRIPPDSTL